MHDGTCVVNTVFIATVTTRPIMAFAQNRYHSCSNNVQIAFLVSFAVQMW